MSSTAAGGLAAAERRIVFLVAAVQFVNIVDFMMVTPLGPDFAQGLQIPMSQLGLVTGSYTGAAAVSGLAGAFFLDRFDRRTALTVAMVGLLVGTAAAGFATGLGTLVAARMLGGMFGGPATSLSISIVADTIPPERRGRAMGVVMGSFSAASVLGVPAGLELSRIGGWSLPFFALAAVGLVIAVLVYVTLPPLRQHLERAPGAAADGGFGLLLQRPGVVLQLAASMLIMLASFILIPNLATYFQFNRGYPREHMGILFVVGGAVSFLGMRLSGAVVDRIGAPGAAAIATFFILAVLFVGFVVEIPEVPVMAIFVGFMVSQSFRNVAVSTLATKVPPPQERARFQSLQSAVQHLSSASGAIASTTLLQELPDHRLIGVPRIALFSMTLSLVVPLLLWHIDRRIRVPPAQ